MHYRELRTVHPNVPIAGGGPNILIGPAIHRLAVQIVVVATPLHLGGHEVRVIDQYIPFREDEL